MTDVDALTISPAKLNSVAGCNPVTFRAWRRRNGLLRHRHPVKDVGDKRAHRFALIDVVLVRCMVEMVRHGFAAEDAVEVVNDRLFETQLRLMIDGDWSGGSVLGVLREQSGDHPLHMIYARPSDAISYLLAKSEGGAAITIVDLQRIIDRVVKDLAADASEGDDAPTNADPSDPENEAA